MIALRGSQTTTAQLVAEAAKLVAANQQAQAALKAAYGIANAK